MPGPYIDTKSSLVVVKSFPYRGGTKEWSNRYHTNGPTTISPTLFNTLADAVVAAEKAQYSGGITIVRVDWADASTATSTNPHGLVAHTRAYTTAGTFVATGGSEMPGDCAAVMSFPTSVRNTKNKLIYLHKYWHNVFRDNSSTADTVLASQRTAYNAYGQAWVNGFSDGTNTHILCSPRGAVAQSRTLLTYIRHRDFPT
jgi:hypothetical protein